MATVDRQQPDPQYVIEALFEELRTRDDNRMYLLAVIKQMQAEFSTAQAEWELERESLRRSQERET